MRLNFAGSFLAIVMMSAFVSLLGFPLGRGADIDSGWIPPFTPGLGAGSGGLAGAAGDAGVAGTAGEAGTAGAAGA